MPRAHRITTQIIIKKHTKFLHQFLDAVTNELGQTYSIPQMRTEVRRAVRSCQRCKNAKAKALPPQMSQLPIARVTPFNPPFTFTGVDFAGPLLIKINRSNVKRWIVIFTCLTIRAIHLEVAHSLSTDSFVLCLNNFLNRRGMCREIYSDRGTNFVGTDRALKLLMQQINYDDVSSQATLRQVK